MLPSSHLLRTVLALTGDEILRTGHSSRNCVLQKPWHLPASVLAKPKKSGPNTGEKRMRAWASSHVGPLFNCRVWTSPDLGFTAKGTLALWDGRRCVSDDGYLHCPWRLWPSLFLQSQLFRKAWQANSRNRPTFLANFSTVDLRLYWHSKSWASSKMNPWDSVRFFADEKPLDVRAYSF